MSQENKPEIPKYEYYVKTWGGFFNDHNKAVHGFSEADSWFSTKEDRDNYIATLDKAVEDTKELTSNGDVCLVKHLAEGYNTRTLPTIHRVVEYKGKRVYSKNEICFPDFNFQTLEYHAYYKWYPGFNDYAVKSAFPDEEVDYTKVKIIQEWISGSIDIEVLDL